MATVLLVDDEKETVESIKMFFDAQGVNCWIALNSNEALQLLKEHHPDFVFLDARLDGSALDGFGVLQEAKKLPLNSKIYMVTGFHDEQKEAQSKAMGAAGYLTKPLTLDKLSELIQAPGSGSP